MRSVRHRGFKHCGDTELSGVLISWFSREVGDIVVRDRRNGFPIASLSCCFYLKCKITLMRSVRQSEDSKSLWGHFVELFLVFFHDPCLPRFLRIWLCSRIVVLRSRRHCWLRIVKEHRVMVHRSALVKLFGLTIQFIRVDILKMRISNNVFSTCVIQESSTTSLIYCPNLCNGFPMIKIHLRFNVVHLSLIALWIFATQIIEVFFLFAQWWTAIHNPRLTKFVLLNVGGILNSFS